MNYQKKPHETVMSLVGCCRYYLEVADIVLTSSQCLCCKENRYGFHTEKYNFKAKTFTNFQKLKGYKRGSHMAPKKKIYWCLKPIIQWDFCDF